MQTVTTKAMAKVAAVATGLAMATSMLALAPMAHAAALTDAQVQSILSLLSSFGADASTIANVQASLTGGTPSVPSTPSSYTFTKDLTVGSKGADVTALQNALIAKGFGIAAGATGYFGAQTVAAVKAWQASAGVSPAAGYFGAKSRAAFGGVSTTPTTPGTPITGNGLKVALASDSPNNIALVAGQAIGSLAKFTFANPTSADIKVTNLGFKRTGISNDSTLANVYLYNGAMRLTDSAGVSNTAFNFNDSTGLFTVPAGQTVTVSVLADVATGTSGQQIGAQLVSVTSTGTLDSSVSFPVNGYTQTVSAATLATVDFNNTALPATNTALSPQNDITVWQNTVTIGTRAVTLKGFQLQNIGSIAKTDVKNLRLYVDGVQAGTAASIDSSNIITWDLSAAPLRLETGGRVVKVVGDVVGGSSLTFKLSLRRASDAQMVDTDLNQPVLATRNGGSAFTALHGGVQTIASGTVSITKATNSPSSNVSVGATNVKWATFEMRAAGEDIKVDNLDIIAITTLDHGLDNGKIFLNGVQVGSTKDLTDYATGGTGVNFTFGSSFILKAGATAIVDVYADAKTTTGAAYANGDTAQIELKTQSGNGNGTGQVSLSSIDVPGSLVQGTAITISSSSMTMTKYSGYGAQTMIAGTNGARLGSFVLSTGATEGVNVNTITVTLSADEAATITDLKLVDSTGAQIGTTKPTLSTSNSYSVNLTIPASGTKTIDVIGNIKSSSNIGTWAMYVDGSGTGSTTGGSVTFGSATAATAELQTITVSTAALTAAVGTSPNNANVIAGASLVKVGSFDFTSRYSTWTVDKIRVKVLSNAATAVASVVLRYPNASGVSTDSTAVLASPSSTEQYATATFTGLTFYIPSNSTKKMDVYVNLASIQADADSGKAVTVTLDDTGGFNKVDSAGTANTTLTGTGDLASSATGGKGTMYVRKSVPTLSAVALDSSTLSAGSNKTIARFKVTADAAGDVAWAKVAFKIQKTYGITLGATTTLQLWQGSNAIAGTFATTTGSLLGGLQAFPATNYAGATTDLNLAFIPTAEQTVSAGTPLTYELRTTVGGLATNGNSLDVSIANAQTTASTTATSAQVGTDANTTNSFIWSDKSKVSATHSLTTSDWTDDYLVNTLPLTVGNMSVTI